MTGREQGDRPADNIVRHVERIEALQARLDAAYADAEADGFRPHLVREVVRHRRLDDEERFILATYRRALGMAD